VRVIAAVPACGIVAGCAVGIAWSGPSAHLLTVLLAVALAGAMAAVACARPALVAGSVAAGCVVAGVLLADMAWRGAWRSSLRIAFESISRDAGPVARKRQDVAAGAEQALVALSGVLREDAALTASGAVSLRLRVRWMGRARSNMRGDAAANPVDGDVLLTVAGALAPERMNEWRRGRSVRMVALLRRPSRYLNPGVPDYEVSLARRGISLVGTVKSGALVELVATGGALSELAAAGRAFARRAIRSAVGRWSDRSAGIVSAIVIGDRSGLDPDVERRLQEAGTYHVIAISGGNIAILTGLALAVFRLAGVLGPLAMLVAGIGLLAYGALVGAGASVARATLMATVHFAGLALDLRGPALNTLAVVAGFLVAARPLSVADPGFLLTVGATAGILAVPADCARARRLVPAPVVALGLASLAAEAVLLPVGASFFSRVTFAGLALNFLAIPLMAVAQIAGMAAVPMFAVSQTAASTAGWLAHIGADGLVRTSDFVSLMPLLTWRVAPPSMIAVACYYASGLAWWILQLKRRTSGSREGGRARQARRLAAVLFVSAAAWILWEPWALAGARGDGRLHVTFLDVGQGDAAFVQFPRGATLLVDAGGLAAGPTFDIGDRVVAPVLRETGVRRLGTLVLTHGDVDHVGGAKAVLSEFRPWDIWGGIPVANSALLQRLRKSAGDLGTRWTQVQAADETTVDDVRVVVRHPARPDWERQDVRNDDSIVLELLWRDVSIVLTGDIGAQMEGQIASSFDATRLRVVKVPHHGSLTSSSDSFVRRLAPAVAVVSAGRNNTFGHPASGVLERYRAVGAEIFRTDRDGAVSVHTDGRSLDVETVTGRAIRFPAPISAGF
jgi:competence protein ComEC